MAVISVDESGIIPVSVTGIIKFYIFEQTTCNLIKTVLDEYIGEDWYKQMGKRFDFIKE